MKNYQISVAFNAKLQAEKTRQAQSFAQCLADLHAENQILLQKTRDDLWKQLKFID